MNYNLLIGTEIKGTDLQKQLNAIPKEQRTTTVYVKANTTQIKELYKEGNKTFETIKKLDKEGNVLSTTFTKMSTSADKVGNSLDKVSKESKTLSQRFLDNTKKVAQFGASTAILGAFTSAVYKAVEEVKNFDDAQVELRKVSDLSGESLTAYTEKLQELGKAVYRSKTEMTEASTIFEQAGYSDDDSARLAQMASLFQNISDKEIEASDSASFIISQLKSFNLTADESIQVLDQVNAVSNNYASSTNDLSTALTKNASVFATYGNSLSNSIALTTGAVEQMPNQAGKVSNGLRAIAIEIANLQTKGKTLDLQVANTTKQIDLFSESGEALSTFDVLTEIDKNWENMNTTERNSIATMLAHKTQANVFLALMNNYNTVLDANVTALTSQGSAWKENEARADSLDVAIRSLNAEFIQLVTKGDSLKDLGVTFLNLGTDILKFANSDVGQVIIKTTALSTAFNLLNIAMKSTTATNIISWIMKIPTAMALATDATAGLTVALETLNINPVVLGITALTAVVVVGYKAIKNYNERLEDATDKTSELAEESKNAQSDLKSVTDSLDNVKKAINSINPLSITDEQDLKNLQAQESSLLRQQALLENNAEIARKNAEEQAKTTLETTSRYDTEIELRDGGVQKGGRETGTYTEQLQSAIDQYEKLRELSKEMDIGDSLDKVNESGTEVATTLNTLVESLTSTDDETVALKSSITDIIDKWNTITGATEQATQAQEDFSDEAEDSNDILSEQDYLVQSLSDSLGNMSDLYETISSAQQEYIDNNGLSVDTYEKLLSYGDQYLSMLFDENGQLLDTATAVEKVYTAKVNELAISKAREILDTASQNTAQGTSFRNLADDIDIATDSLWGFVTANYAMENINDENKSQANDLINNIDKWRKSVIDNMSVQVQQVSVTKSSTSATKKHTDAIKEQNDALKDQLDDYEKVIDYIDKRFDKEADKLKDEEDAIVKSLESRIDVLKDQQSYENDYYDDITKKIEDERDTRLDAIDKEKKAIEDRNKAMDDTLERQQLLDNLAKAKNTREFVMGADGRFQYVPNQAKVSEAQKALDEYDRKKRQQQELDDLQLQRDNLEAIYEQQIDDLNNKKEAVSENYDAQIEDLENQTDAIENSYGEQINAVNMYKEQFDTMVGAYAETQNRLLAEQLTGIDFEQKNWMQRLVNESNFVNEYNRIQAQLQTAQQQQAQTVQSNYTPTSGGSGGSGSSSSKPSTPTKINGGFDDSDVVLTNPAYTAPKTTHTSSRSTVSASKQRQLDNLMGFATGVDSVSEDGIYQVGDEIVMGKNVNGVPIHMGEGTGVVNAESTKTISGILNTIGRMGSNAVPINNNTSDNHSVVVQNMNVDFPNATNKNEILSAMNSIPSMFQQQKFSTT